jgi:hypothetical protein
MVNENKPGLGRRAASAAGRVGVKVGKHSAAWIGRNVIVPAVVTLALIAGLTYIFLPYIGAQIAKVPTSLSEMLFGVKLPPQVQLDEANHRCAITAGYHDGETKIERLGAEMAHINLATATGKTVSQIYEDLQTLVVPGSKVASIRSCTFDYNWYHFTRAQKGKWSQAEIALDGCLDNRSKCFKDNPWLQCVKYEIRNTWRGATPGPDYTLRSDTRVKRVYPENPGPDDAEFFCDAEDAKKLK